MEALHLRLGLAMGFAMAVSVSAQTPAGLPADSTPPQTGIVPGIASEAAAIPVATTPPAVQTLQSFREGDVKFDLRVLLRLLRDPNHEGWVLAAYPDPKTGQPLIGAGVSLDLPAREHSQHDPLNPHPFLEPASAELWQAAGLEPSRLNRILDDFHARLAMWDMHEYRGHIRELTPQISDEEAIDLLRIAAVQSILNAKAYCRRFDELSASQQMALSQLVFQMGMNLEEFTEFLSMINSDWVALPAARTVTARDVGYWSGVQKSLIQSQWARLYRVRAISVIAMLDPRYNQNPRMAERRVGVTLRPAVVHRHRGRTQLASTARIGGAHGAKKARRAHSKRKA